MRRFNLSNCFIILFLQKQNRSFLIRKSESPLKNNAFLEVNLNLFYIDITEPPANVHITEVTKNSVSLAWQRPPYDGGSKITGYNVERREASNGRWVKANFSNIIEMGFTVSGLSQDESYEFRVYAKNAVGSVSGPSLIAGPVSCVDACGK